MKTTVTSAELEATVRRVLSRQGRLGSLANDLDPATSLADAGLSSLACVDVMLALESEYGEFPEAMLSASVFRSIETITAGLSRLHLG